MSEKMKELLEGKFVEGDTVTVDADGGNPRLLTSGGGPKSTPYFSTLIRTR